MARKQTTTKRNSKTTKRNGQLAWFFIIVISFLLMMFTITKMGIMGNILNNVCTYVFGSLYIGVLITLFISGCYILFSKEKRIDVKTTIGLIVLNMAIMMISGFISKEVNVIKTDFVPYLGKYVSILFTDEAIPFSGGIMGNLLYGSVATLFTRTGAIIVIITLIAGAALLLVPLSVYKDMFFETKDMISETKERAEDALEERRRKKEELRALRAQEEEERRLKLAEEMNSLEPDEEENVINFNDFENETDSTLKEVPVTKTVVEKELDYSILSKSPTWINLKESEIYGNVREHHEPVMTHDDFIMSEKEEPVIEMPVKEEKPAEPEIPFAKKKEEPKVLKRKPNSIYRLPKPVEEFLEANTSKASSVNKTSAEMKGQKLVEILQSFDIDAELLNTYIGPSVTKFEIKPKGNVRINKIISISDNIKMELAARDIRIEAPIPGRSAVGVEIPNVEPIPVKMIDLMKKVPNDKKEQNLMFALGKDLMGESVYCNLAKMPHLLIAGATGSGKSVCINTIITSFLFRTKPEDVRLVLVDPKKVEFTPYKDIPHLLWPIIDDSTMASNMLKKIVVIMEERYDLFAACGVRNIETYNNMVKENNEDPNQETKMEKLPYIVVIIDELADLMAIAKKDVELSIQRITQLARASGIHLIVATQRPSTDVITGLIKSNIPSRISFAVASAIDSRTILDSVGAERLLGNGDMLYSPQGENSPRRLQGVYVTDSEIRKITSYVKTQGKPEYEDSFFEFLTNMTGSTVMSNDGPGNADSQDSLFDEVVEFVRVQQKASTSLLQRRFGIGYNRAARLIDTLEDRGIIGPANGSKPREVFLKEDEE